MNIAAKNYKPATTTLDGTPLSAADSLRLTIVSFSCELAAAVVAAGEVTATRCAPIDKAQEKLQAARFYWHRAVERGASPEQLAQMAADGKAVAAAVAAAEPIAEEGRKAKALRAIERAAKAAAKAEKRLLTLKLQRQYILNNTTKEAAHHVARELASKGLYAEPREALAAIVAEVTAAGVLDLKATTPEHILAAWLRLDP